jgi:hypothetical protein
MERFGYGMWDKDAHKPHGYKLEGKELEGSLAFSQFDAAGTICALSFSNSSCSVRAGVINPQNKVLTVSVYMRLHDILKRNMTVQAANIMPSSIRHWRGGFLLSTNISAQSKKNSHI